MYLIASAAYVNEELRNEVGKIPPSFLPLRNQRLFMHQISTFCPTESVYLTIPEDFLIDEFDDYLLKSLNVELIKIPLNLSLGESIYKALSVIDRFDDGLKILHGDTFVGDVPMSSDDFIVASQIIDDYEWSGLLSKTDLGLYMSGFFSFSDLKLFYSLLRENSYNFVQSVNKYCLEVNSKIVKSTLWLDLGHISTYYRSRAHMPGKRHFNSIEIDSKVVLKQSIDNEKIRAEFNWFLNVPLSIKYYTPQIVSVNDTEDKASYKLEYLCHLPLNELFVYGKQPLFKWKRIFESCKEFLDACGVCKPSSAADFLDQGLFLEKTYKRLSEFYRDNEFTNRPLFYGGIALGSLEEIAVEVSKFIPNATSECISILHGDFCFSNILYDFRKCDIKVIDPRGISVNGNQSIYGDQRYDYSKLAHSVIGLYDFIIAERYYLEVEDNNYLIKFPENIEIGEVQNLFWTYFLKDERNCNVDKKYLYASMIHLFISMLPLHRDSRQRQSALIANSLRLYLEFNKL